MYISCSTTSKQVNHCFVFSPGSTYIHPCTAQESATDTLSEHGKFICTTIEQENKQHVISTIPQIGIAQECQLTQKLPLARQKMMIIECI